MAKVVIIGGGPAGMMASIAASEDKVNDVIIIEKNEKLGKKLFITGKGRCNVTNKKYIQEFFDHITTNSNFLYSALYSFTNEDTINFFEERKVPLKVERGDRVFPQSNKSSDIIKALKSTIIQNGVKVKLNSEVSDIIVSNKRILYILLKNGEKIYGDYFIMCTGGCSYPQTGSNGYGYKLAQKLGHKIIKPKPSLVPLEFKENCVKELQGLSLKNVSVKIEDTKGKILYKNFGEMIFTHFGASGPIVLTGSKVVSNNTDKNLKFIINLKPALTSLELDKRIQKDFKKFINKDFKNSLNDLLPKKIISTIIKLSNINQNKKVNLITKEERRKLVHIIQNLTFSIKNTRPIEEAIVTSGGVDVKDINSSTMASKIIDNLYFAGELIDVDANTGGFNIQIALSTGYLAGISIKNRVKK